MRILPRVSQPTLESFRKDVYRPRLSLLVLLILMLGGQESKYLGSQGTSGSTTPALLFNSVGISDRLPSERHPSFLQRLSQLPFTQSGSVEKQKNLRRKKGVCRQKEATTPATTDGALQAERTAQKTEKIATIPPTSFFRLPKLGFIQIFRSQTLAAILPLHILWIVRLGGMVVEDGISKPSTATKQLQQSVWQVHRHVLLSVAVLAIIAFGAPLLCSSTTLQVLWSWAVSNDFSNSEEMASMLSLRLIILLELSATLLSLLCPLMKLNNPRLTPHLPSQVLLPSPSHAPPLIELVPLPPGLADVLTGRAAEELQSRDSQGRRIGRRRPRSAGVIINPTGHGAFLPAAEPALHTEGTAATRRRFVDAPLTLGSRFQEPLRYSPGKAPRISGVKVQVESSWLLENIVIMWGHFVGTLEYLIVALSLPTLSPTSIWPFLALLSLRSSLCALAFTWTSARKSVECLEFVRRRWPASSQAAAPYVNTHRWRADQEAEILCPICFEHVQHDKEARDPNSITAESCRLDCGHELHAVCLVQLFLGSKQAFCPCCHDPLRATPPTAATADAPPNLTDAG